MPIEVKICGLSTEETVRGAITAGADYIGLVFYPASPRHVSLEQAERLARTARGRAKIVALVVDASEAAVKDIARRVRPDYFQAHGREDARKVEAIRATTGVPVIKAVKVQDTPDLAQAETFETIAEMVLFDAKAPSGVANVLPGGNGMAFDWSILARRPGRKRFMLSGGLTADNVMEAIRISGAPIVDVSTGVERAPGAKDLGLIRSFIDAAKKDR
ncbi:MAG TPA: phosphoribosylanthranilate isomerase [Aestuariivirgaceae bacterium]|jgi:phosphoribosylanthranilate isomerase